MDESRSTMRKLIAGGIIITALACLTILMAGRSAHLNNYVIGWVIAGAIGMIVGLVLFLSSAKRQPAVIESNENIERILVRASHDLRTPMNTILNYSHEPLIEKYNPKELLEALSKINDAGAFMMTLMDDIVLMFSNKDFKLKEQPTTIVSCIEPSVEMMMPRFKKMEQTVTLDFHEIDKYRYVMADEQRIKQILMNLLSNANRHTPVGGHIAVVVDGHMNDMDQCVNVNIRVKDTGVGMSKKQLSSLRQAFSGKQAHVGGDIGLGLSVVYRLVHAMHGDLKIKSIRDKGTEFVVSLKWNLTNKEDEEVTYDFSILQGKHVLLVDNNHMSIEIAMFLLENQGMTFDVAENGKEGVAMFTHAMPHTYAAILMDIKMPVMDGLEATRTIRASRHPEANQIPIIAMTANALEDDKKKSEEAGMNAHVAKPINPDELYRTLSNYISRI